jgi:hypothetical protein
MRITPITPMWTPATLLGSAYLRIAPNAIMNKLAPIPTVRSLRWWTVSTPVRRGSVPPKALCERGPVQISETQVTLGGVPPTATPLLGGNRMEGCAGQDLWMRTFAFMPGTRVTPLAFIMVIFTGMYWSIFCGLLGSLSGLGKKENSPAVEPWISET